MSNFIKIPSGTVRQRGPSGQLILRYFSDAAAGDGYRVRQTRPNGRAVELSYAEQRGFICLRGEKPNLSFDNRLRSTEHDLEEN